jgi:hypothetical protein
MSTSTFQSNIMISSQKTNDHVINSQNKKKENHKENHKEKIDSKNGCSMYEEDIHYKYYLERNKNDQTRNYNYINNNNPNPSNMYEEYAY